MLTPALRAVLTTAHSRENAVVCHLLEHEPPDSAFRITLLHTVKAERKFNTRTTDSELTFTHDISHLLRYTYVTTKVTKKGCACMRHRSASYFLYPSHITHLAH